MRVRQIGTFVFDANTNIVVDAINQDAPGIGFHTGGLFDPQPFAAEIAFRRATRQQALDAVSTLARELHSYAQRRQDGRFAVAGGALVVAEDASGGTSLRSFLRDGSVSLLGVEATSTGVIARVRVAGTLVNPFLNYTFTTTTLSALAPYERRIITLTGTSDAYLYKNDLICFPISNLTGLYNTLIAVEELESATGTSRIQAISPATVTSGITIQNQSWNAGWQTLTRAYFVSATGGTITYTITTAFPNDVYRLFIEIFCPTAPSSSARYIVSWDGQPQIAETITGDRSWYTPALFVRGDAPITLTLVIQNVPTNTLVMPVVLIPADGVSVWSVIGTPTLSYFHILSHQSASFRPFRVDPSGTIYGAPGFVSSRYVAVFIGMMAPTITSASADLMIRSRRIEPASFA
jgi:hypothetical protein